MAIKSERAESIIRLTNLTKKFGRVTAINNVSLEFSKGLNIILGPNGAGKSTLLRCIDGLYKADNGRVSVLGEDPYLSNGLKTQMSLLSDNYALYDHLSVIGNLKFFGRLDGLKDAEIDESAKRFLKELDAMQYINSRVYQLSRGTKQKVAFCRSVLNDPRILLLDEPTAFLDASASEVVRNFMLNYEKEGRTVLFVTQKLDEVTRFNGRVVVIRRGSVVKDVTIEQLYGSMLRDIDVSIRLATPISLKLAKSIPGFQEANSAKPTMVKIRVRDYKSINKVLSYLIDNDAYIASVYYIEPVISGLSSGKVGD